MQLPCFKSIEHSCLDPATVNSLQDLLETVCSCAKSPTQNLNILECFGEKKVELGTHGIANMCFVARLFGLFECCLNVLQMLFLSQSICMLTFSSNLKPQSEMVFKFLKSFKTSNCLLNIGLIDSELDLQSEIMS